MAKTSADMVDVMDSEAISRRRLLYIEDDASFARLAQRRLTRMGLSVDIAETGAAGLSKLTGGYYDGVVLDYHLPDGSSFDFLGAIKKFDSELPVVYVTGDDDARTAVAALKAGAADYVVKSLDEGFFELLAAAIRASIDSADLRKEKAHADQEVMELSEQRAALLGEVNHRVANSLQLLVSMIGLQLSSTKDIAVKAALQDIAQRIGAIASLHQRLYTSHDIRFVAIDEYFERLLEALRTSLVTQGHITLELQAMPLNVATDKAVKLGIIVNELVTNAVKYAFPSGRKGLIRITVDAADQEWHLLSIQDDGVGMKSDTQAVGSGLGQQIVDIMVRGIGGRLKHIAIAKGTKFQIAFQADAPASASGHPSS
jgi:two-component sensor histidine kinase